jgi:enoyl-CoA hydratase
MRFETLILDREGPIRIITLNRPERLNAVNYQLHLDFERALAEIEEDDEVRTVILTGAGKGFCAGADIKEMDNPNAKKLPAGRYAMHNKLEDLGKPVIAAINGACNGGGLELVLCCDFRVAAEGASFGLGEVKLGVIPAAGGTARLPRLIGAGRAKEFLYFGNIVDAKEAYRIGLVNKVVSPEGLMAEARRWAMELAERPPLSLRMLKHCVNIGMQMDLIGAIDYESKCFAALLNTEDCEEGRRAFVEKRRPVFKGR